GQAARTRGLTLRSKTPSQKALADEAMGASGARQPLSSPEYSPVTDIEAHAGDDKLRRQAATTELPFAVRSAWEVLSDARRVGWMVLWLSLGLCAYGVLLALGLPRILEGLAEGEFSRPLISRRIVEAFLPAVYAIILLAAIFSILTLRWGRRIQFELSEEVVRPSSRWFADYIVELQRSRVYALVGALNVASPWLEAAA